MWRKAIFNKACSVLNIKQFKTLFYCIDDFIILSFQVFIQILLYSLSLYPKVLRESNFLSWTNDLLLFHSWFRSCILVFWRTEIRLVVSKLVISVFHIKSLVSIILESLNSEIRIWVFIFFAIVIIWCSLRVLLVLLLRDPSLLKFVPILNFSHFWYNLCIVISFSFSFSNFFFLNHRFLFLKVILLKNSSHSFAWLNIIAFIKYIFHLLSLLIHTLMSLIFLYDLIMNLLMANYLLNRNSWMHVSSHSKIFLSLLKFWKLKLFFELVFHLLIQR